MPPKPKRLQVSLKSFIINKSEKLPDFEYHGLAIERMRVNGSFFADTPMMRATRRAFGIGSLQKSVQLETKFRCYWATASRTFHLARQRMAPGRGLFLP